MKVSGFTIIRNATTLDYPIVEAIKSILPICDEVVVAVGKSDDNTLDVIRAIHPGTIRIIETIWDDGQRAGGRVLAMESDKALAAVSDDTDWCFYIQAEFRRLSFKTVTPGPAPPIYSVGLVCVAVTVTRA